MSNKRRRIDEWAVGRRVCKRVDESQVGTIMEKSADVISDSNRLCIMFDHSRGEIRSWKKEGLRLLVEEDYERLLSNSAFSYTAAVVEADPSAVAVQPTEIDVEEYSDAHMHVEPFEPYAVSTSRDIGPEEENEVIEVSAPQLSLVNANGNILIV
jgi:hypothetical protein